MMSGSIILMLGDTGQKFVKMLMLPVLTQHLSLTELGILGSIKAIQATLGMVYNPGLISGFTRKFYTFDLAADRKSLISAASYLTLVFPLISSILALGLIFGLRLDWLGQYHFWWILPCAFYLGSVSPFMRLWSTINTINKTYNVIFIRILVTITLDVIITLAFIKTHTLNARLCAIVISSLFALSIAIFDLRKFFSFSFKHVKSLLLFGLPLAPLVISWSILDISDRFMIQYFGGLDSLGSYSVVYTLSSILLFFSVGFRKLFTMQYFESSKDGSLGWLQNVSFNYIFLISIGTLILMAISEDLIQILLGSEFLDASQSFQILLVGKYFLCLVPILTPIYLDNFKFNALTRYIGMAAILNIALNFYFIPHFGSLGAVYSTLICYFIYYIFLLIGSYKDMGKNPRKRVFIYAPAVVLSFLFVLFL